MKKFISTYLLLCFTLIAGAQILEPVKFSATLKTGNTANGEIVFTGKIDKGWHVYSTNLGNDGPIEASLTVNNKEGIELVGKLTAVGNEKSEFDELFGMKLRFFENNVKFVQKVKFTKPDYSIDCYLTYGACNDQNCLPPSDVELKKAGKSPAIDSGVKAEDEAKAEERPEATTQEEDENADAVVLSAVDSTAVDAGSDLWVPIVDELKAVNTNNDIAGKGLSYIFFMGIVGGLLALVMPCIWPIIPMT